MIIYSLILTAKIIFWFIVLCFIVTAYAMGANHRMHVANEEYEKQKEYQKKKKNGIM